jgi:hypothetical protein
VTSLEPRTPHQPGKLQKLSKNDYVFTLFIFRVNKKRGNVCGYFSIECTRFTGGCSGVGAVFLSHDFVTFANARFSWTFLADAVAGCEPTWAVFVKIAGKTALDAGAADFLSCLCTSQIVDRRGLSVG